MKTLGLVFGVLAASLSCAAQSSSESVTESNKFVICQDGKPFCKIKINGVGPGLPPEGQMLYIEDGRRLQRYFYLLSDCQIPIEYVDPIAKDQLMAFKIEVDTYPYIPRDFGTARIYIRDRTLFFRDREPRSGETMRDGRLVRVEHPRIAGLKVLDEFGQRCFGVPLSAIDDPNYQWPKKPTLLIDVDKFEPIEYPRKPTESPKRPNQ
jgi:hypothetical protein